MPDPITLSLIVGAALGGVVEALAGKTADKAPDLARRAQRLVTLKQELPLSRYAAAVRAAVDAARQDVLAEVAAGEADLGEPHGEPDALTPVAAKAKLGYDFRIGTYPVTNAEYRRFVQTDGYEQSKPWWSKQAIKDIVRYWSVWPSGPRLWSNPQFDKATQPVVAISWYEAVAYCAWLTVELHRRSKITGDEQVRLPTEAEWEWAAAGSGQHRYPWGDMFADWRCNSKESALGQPTPVYMCSDGRTPEGVWDLAGNVWEWSNDDYDQWSKVLRGGAYWNDANGVGAVARNWYTPRYRSNELGFRVVVAPVSGSG